PSFGRAIRCSWGFVEKYRKAPATAAAPGRLAAEVAPQQFTVSRASPCYKMKTATKCRNSPSHSHFLQPDIPTRANSRTQNRFVRTDAGSKISPTGSLYDNGTTTKTTN